MGKVIFCVICAIATLVGMDAGAGFTKKVRGALDRMDRDEAVPDMDDPIGYGHMDATQRAVTRGWF